MTLHEAHDGVSEPRGELADPDMLVDAVQLRGHHQVRVDRTRDALITDFGRATLDNRYLLPGEGYQDLFARVASCYGDDPAHAQRIYDYISRHWFMPATRCSPTAAPPAACRSPASSTRHPTAWRASSGCGTRMSGWPPRAAASVQLLGQSAFHRREGRPQNGKTSGVIPFIRVMDSLTLAISPGFAPARARPPFICRSLTRRWRSLSKSAGRPAATRTARRSISITASWCTDAFMRAVEADDELGRSTSPKDGSRRAHRLGPGASGFAS